MSLEKAKGKAAILKTQSCEVEVKIKDKLNDLMT